MFVGVLGLWVCDGVGWLQMGERGPEMNSGRQLVWLSDVGVENVSGPSAPLCFGRDDGEGGWVGVLGFLDPESEFRMTVVVWVLWAGVWGCWFVWVFRGPESS